MKSLWIIPLAALAAFFMSTAEAQYGPQIPCAPRPMVVKSLTVEHKEQVIMRGITNGRMLEIWRNAEGSFSVTITHAANHMTCLLTNGDSLHFVKQVEKGPSS